MVRLGVLVAGLLLSLTATSGAADPVASAPNWTTQLQVVPRKALVIGISAYDHATQLATPQFDVVKVAATLKALGFASVTVVQNDDPTITDGRIHVTRENLLTAVTQFADSLNENDVAMIFYSGHGVEIGSYNFLVPSNGEARPDLPMLSYVGLQWMLAKIQDKHPTAIFIVLDACRADPFIGVAKENRDVLAVPVPNPPRAIGSGGGLAYPTGPATSYLIGFAAQPMTPAYSRFVGDPDNAQSIYTRVLAQQLLSMPTLDKALFYTEKNVGTLTNGSLVPNEARSAFYDLPIDATKPDPDMAEQRWRLIVGIGPVATQAAELSKFLEDYPLSQHALAARARLAAIANMPSAATINTVSLPDPAAATPQPLLGSLQGPRIEGGTTTAFVAKPTTLSAKPGSPSMLSRLNVGIKVNVLQLFAKGRALIQTVDGRVGYIGGVLRAATDNMRRVVQLNFLGSDEYADVQSWTQLGASYFNFGLGSSAVTIRSGPSGNDDPAAQRAVARLRALRIRDYVHRLGVPEARIVIVSDDPGVPKDTATVSLSPVVS